MERFFKKNEPPRGDETELCRPFDTEGRADEEHPEAIVRATPVKTRPLFDLEKLRIYLEKLRASFKFGPSPQSLLRRIEQLARELKEIASRAGTTSNVFELFTSWKSDKANRTADVAADIATLSQKLATEDKTQNTPIDCTVDAAAEIATLKQKLTAVESRIRENAKSTPTLDDLRERMAALLRDPPTLDAARTLRATVQVMHGRALESANAAPEWPQLVAAFIARELGFVGMA
jgi:chromosome segregation ATPase